MSVETPETIPGLDQANAELDRMIAADAAAERQAAAGAKPGESANKPEERAAGAEKIESTQDPNKKSDTPATADPKKSTEAKPADKPAAEQAQKSRYEKARERQEGSWKELNAQKDAFKAEREAFERDKAEFQARRQQAEQEFTPEQYDEAARKFEDEGKFEFAEMAKKKAEALRKDPETAARKQRDQATATATEAQRKEWALKAGVDFPELAKDNSATQLRVAQLFKEEPDLKAHPKGIYMAARLATLEAAAAGVADKDKELGQLRARVKELEELTTSSPPGGAAQLPAEKPFEQKDAASQLKELEEQAVAMGTLR
jgi:hypothetical protein